MLRDCVRNAAQHDMSQGRRVAAAVVVVVAVVAVVVVVAYLRR